MALCAFGRCVGDAENWLKASTLCATRMNFVCGDRLSRGCRANIGWLEEPGLQRQARHDRSWASTSAISTGESEFTRLHFGTWRSTRVTSSNRISRSAAVLRRLCGSKLSRAPTNYAMRRIFGAALTFTADLQTIRRVDRLYRGVFAWRKPNASRARGGRFYRCRRSSGRPGPAGPWRHCR